MLCGSNKTIEPGLRSLDLTSLPSLKWNRRGCPQHSFYLLPRLAAQLPSLLRKRYVVGVLRIRTHSKIEYPIQGFDTINKVWYASRQWNGLLPLPHISIFVPCDVRICPIMDLALSSLHTTSINRPFLQYYCREPSGYF